ncbi:fimbrial protein [Acinetobacter terrestris]|uniref:fimbrial protein n=1 Tax=Acinetobacter terrestris TaxID=2529843 RepID=UPI00352318CA
MLDIKKVLLTSLLSTMVIAPAFAEEDVEPITVQGGTVHFQGSIVNSPCVVDVNSANQTVNLGQFQSTAFDGVDSTSSPVNFDINLISCDTETLSNARITFKGQTLEGQLDKLAPAATQAADSVAGNVGIQILQDSAVLDVSGKDSSEKVALLDGSNKLAFQARYIATGDVTVGSANASADFTVTYE